MSSTATYTLVGTVKDEGPYLLEWITYYKQIGFNQIVIASNDCGDGTTEMLDYLHHTGAIIHLENSDQIEGKPADPQNRAYQRIWDMPEVRSSDWVLVADADEFLNVHAGDGTMAALLSALADLSPDRVDMISASWRVFGNGGQVAFDDAPVIGQFDKAAPVGLQRIQRYTAFKTLFRPRVVKKPSIHRPRLAPRFRTGQRPVNWVNGSGQRMPDRYLTQGWRFFADSYGAALVTMNHYMIKSSEAFLMKRYRGTANSADEDRIDFSYFDTFNANAVTDTSIQRHLPALETALAELKHKHPKLVALHAASLAFHQQKLEHAKEDVIGNLPEMATKLGLI